jgi:hypothetical protein
MKAIAPVIIIQLDKERNHEKKRFVPVFCTTIGQGENKPEIENINHMHPTQVYI